ncbi:hypothetical protein CDAR_570661 [Caerostris darwini]|uniref:Uncharacterized protein n=1 Tax=Caerostris darwini TaxID=1538125 RepID=A0AAV4QGR5_9ARAC|nr:hypothetical protein CDAR_570661 [Caerostris darwini]
MEDNEISLFMCPDSPNRFAHTRSTESMMKVINSQWWPSLGGISFRRNWGKSFVLPFSNEFERFYHSDGFNSMEVVSNLIAKLLYCVLMSLVLLIVHLFSGREVFIEKMEYFLFVK